MELFSTITGLKLIAAAMAAEETPPPLCTNVNHNEITCAESSLPRHKWCEACRSHAERTQDA